MQYTVDETTTITHLTESLCSDPDYVIDTLSFSSSLFEEMKQVVLKDVNSSVTTLDNESVCAVISSVSFFEWIDSVRSKSSKEVTLCFYWDWDVLGVDLMAIDGIKIGCTSWMSSKVITSILLFLNRKEIGMRCHKPSMREIVDMVQKYFYPSHHNCRN